MTVPASNQRSLIMGLGVIAMKKASQRVIRKMQTLHGKLESLERDFAELYPEVSAPDSFDQFKQQVEFWLMDQTGS